MTEQNNTNAQTTEQLPFDPKTLFLGIKQRWKVLAMIVVLSCVVGVLGGIFLGTRIYESETVLLYKPTQPGASSLQTEMNMVKVQPNISEVRRRLSLNATLDNISAAVDVHVQHNTNLMVIRSKWSSAEKAAAVANTLRDVFVGNQQRIQKTVVGTQIQDLEEHLDFVRRQLQSVDAARQKFTTNTGMIDLDVEAQDYLNKLATIDRLYEQTKVDQEAIVQSISNPNQMLGAVGLRFQDQTAMLSELDGFAEMDTRIRWMVNNIQGEKTQRINQAELSKVKKEFERAEKLWERGLISESAYQEALASYEKQKALTTDTQQVEQHKSKLKVLMDQRLKRLDETRQKMKSRLNDLPQIQREYVTVQREVTFWETQQENLESQLAQARRVFESKASDFNVVSNAKISPMPIESNRRLLAIAIAMLGCMVGVGIVIGKEVFETRVRSGAELSIKLPVKLLGTIQKAPPEQHLFPGSTESALIQPFRLIAHQLRQAVPKRGARILVVGAQHGEGTTMVATNLAACFGRQDERVVLLDAQIHPQETDASDATPQSLLVDDKSWEDSKRYPTRELVLSEGAPVVGLGEYLSFEADRIEDITWPTTLPGVSCIPRVGETVIQDMVHSNRMHELLENLSTRFSMVLVDAPPALSYVDASVLAQWCDAIVLVVRSRKSRSKSLKKAVERLKSSGTPIVGSILNDVDPLYLEEEHENTHAL